MVKLVAFGFCSSKKRAQAPEISFLCHPPHPLFAQAPSSSQSWDCYPSLAKCRRIFTSTHLRFFVCCFVICSHSLSLEQPLWNLSSFVLCSCCFETLPNSLCFILRSSCFETLPDSPCFILWSSRFETLSDSPCFILWSSRFETLSDLPCFILWSSCFETLPNSTLFHSLE